MKKLLNVTLVCLMVISGAVSMAMAKGREYKLQSPDSRIEVRVSVDEKLTYEVSYDGEVIIEESPLSMTFANGVVAGDKMRVNNAKNESVEQTIDVVAPTKFSVIEDKFNSLTLRASQYSVVFRAYDQGVAYRFETNFRKPTEVASEEVRYNLSGDAEVIFGLEESMFTHQERLYTQKNLSEFKAGEYASPPVMLKMNEGVRVLLTESDLENYAGVYMAAAGGSAIEGFFPHYPLKVDSTKNDRDFPVVEYAPYIAEVEGKRTYPWRVAIVAPSDAKLLENTLVYQLASPSRVEDASWIKPGVVLWDWWTYLNIYGVDFESGVNNDSYKYYIDAAHELGFDYIILDEGWYDINSGLLDVVPEIDVKELVEYGKKKDVGIILWMTWQSLEEVEDEAMDLFAKWGVSGLKIDFMQRDDQHMVEYYYRIAEKAAERKMLVDYHGSYKPTGLHRTYPNVITFEGVKGMENNKWDTVPGPAHNVLLPYTRQVAGPMDYTPGGMNNQHKGEFTINFYRPNTIGTRAHQLGLYIVFESPLQMVSENPTDLLKEVQTTDFLRQVPTVWDETVGVDGEVGEFVVVARRNGQKWYLGAINGETEREVEVVLDFLGEGTYELEQWADGVNVKRQARDVARSVHTVKKGDKVTLKLAAGGGYAAIFTKK